MKKILLFLATFVMAFALNAQTTYLSEDFENATSGSTVITDWINYDTAAAHANPWEVTNYSGNQYAQASAYGTDTVMSAFLISPAIDLSNAASNINLYFDVKVAYWKHDGLKVMVSTDFTPGTDTLAAIRSATWTDLNVTFPQEPTSGYGDFNNYSVDLSSYQGQTIYIAFVYQGDADNNQTTTYQVDNVIVTDKTPVAIDYVYTLNDTTLVVKYADKFTGFDASTFVVKGSNFIVNNIDLNDSINVMVYTSNAIQFDTQIDTIQDGYNETSVTFYAGFTPISYFNPLNTYSIEQGPFVTIVGYVAANSFYKNIWVSSDVQAAAYNGINVYDASRELPSSVNPWDKVRIVGTYSVYNDMSELVYKALVCLDSSQDYMVTPVTITCADIDKDITANTNPAEQYEGVLVKIENVTISTGPTQYYEYIGSDSTNSSIIIDDVVDYHYSSYDTDTLAPGKTYNLTGVVTYAYGYYRLNPLQKDYNGIELIASAGVNDVPAVNFSVYPNPVANVLSISADENINRIEVFNAVGQQVKGVNVNSSRATLDVSDLNSGVYFLRVYSKDGVSAVKVLKR